MSKITVNAPVDKVFEAVSDLTRHAGWAAHDINISAETDICQSSSHLFGITTWKPNRSLGTKSVMVIWSHLPPLLPDEYL